MVWSLLPLITIVGFALGLMDLMFAVSRPLVHLITVAKWFIHTIFGARTNVTGDEAGNEPVETERQDEKQHTHHSFRSIRKRVLPPCGKVHPMARPRLFEAGWGSVDYSLGYVDAFHEYFATEGDNENNSFFAPTSLPSPVTSPTPSLNTSDIDANSGNEGEDDRAAVDDVYLEKGRELVASTIAQVYQYEDPTVRRFRLRSVRIDGPHRVYLCQFLSPSADLICPLDDPDFFNRRNVRQAEFHLLLPRGAALPACFAPDHDEDSVTADAGKGKPLCSFAVLLPATGEQWTAERMEVARRLADKHGIGSIIVTSPWYGSRRPANQRMHFIRTVADLLNQGPAISWETTTIVNAVLVNTPAHVRICLAGFSFGGAASALTGWKLARVTRDKKSLRRVGVVPYVGGSTATAYCRKSLKADVDFTAVERDQHPPLRALQESSHGFRLSGRVLGKRDLRAVLARIDMHNTALIAPPSAQHTLGALHSFITTHDHFVPRDQSELLFKDTCRFVDAQKTRVTTLNGGHMAAFVCKTGMLSNAVSHMLTSTLVE
jgi:hypothetical protein